MNKDLAFYKIQALLHDPPVKPVILMQTHQRHETYSKEILEILLGSGEIDKSITITDYVASGADRYNFARGEAIKFLQSPIIKNLLSGHVTNLEILRDVNPADLTQSLKKAIQEIKDKAGSDLENLYYEVWRNLPKLLENNSSILLKENWLRLPADTRIPDHSIWVHNRLVSGLRGSEIHKDKTALLLFSIGPVQEFIAAAKKTSDLWAGSYLLSLLAWEGIQAICEEIGPDAFLFPDLFGQPLTDNWIQSKGVEVLDKHTDFSVATFPNRFMCLVPLDKVESLALTAQNAIKEKLKSICKFGFDKAFKKGNVVFEDWEYQVREFLESYWVALPLKHFQDSKDGTDILNEFKGFYGDLLDYNDEALDKIVKALSKTEGAQFNLNSGILYGRLYRTIEHLLGARKSLRNFNQIDESGYRCSLIPSLACITPQKEIKPKGVKEFWHGIAQHSSFKIADSERLSLISIAKRYLPEYLKDQKLFDEPPRFPSTSSFATVSYKKHVLGVIDKVEVQKAIETFKNSLEQLRDKSILDNLTETPIHYIKQSVPHHGLAKWWIELSGAYLFPESLNFKALVKNYSGERNDLSQIEAICKNAQKELITLFKTVDQETQTRERPVKYYAVLMLDGDNMGKWLSGENMPNFTDALHPRIEHPERWIELKSLKRPLSPAGHLAISEALKRFSLEKVRVIVEDRYMGRLIYSGGDDVLAFVSLSDALSVAQEIRDAFSNEDCMGKNATASAGIVFAHHQQSLREVLEQVRKTEKYAKNVLERDALAISTMKRSGEIIQTGTKWDGKLLTKTLSQLSELFNTGYLAGGFLTDIAQLKNGLIGLPIEAIRAETFRLFKRHTPPKDEHKCQHFKESIEPFLEKEDLQTLLDLISTARFIGKRGNR